MPVTGTWRVGSGEEIRPYEVGGMYKPITVNCVAGEVLVIWITDGHGGVQDDNSGQVRRIIKAGNSMAFVSRMITITGQSASNGDYLVAD